MRSWIFAFLVVAVAALPADWPHNVRLYEGYSVIEIIPQSKEELRLLVQIAESDKYDFWKEPGKLQSPVHIMSDTQQFLELTSLLTENGIKFTIHIDDVSKDIKAFLAHQVQREEQGRVFDLDDFNTFEDIEDYLQNTLLPQCDGIAGLTCTLTASDTQSIEARNIWIFTMSTGTPTETILIDGLIHAREWLVGGTVFKLMDRMVNQYGSDADTTEVLDTYDFVFMPVLNPDGYSYSWTDERLWRKNRRDNPGGCFGIDLNRNFDWNFGLQGVSTAPCSDLFCGPNALSEPESVALDNEMQALQDSMVAYVTYHAYGNYWMHPWGNTADFTDNTACERADDHDQMFAVAEATGIAIEDTFGTRWDWGTSCEVIYATTGASDDHVKGNYGTLYPFNPELRGNGFIIAADQIQPSYEENWNGLVAMVRAIAASKKTV